jgi:hypothetical protein
MLNKSCVWCIIFFFVLLIALQYAHLKRKEKFSCPSLRNDPILGFLRIGNDQKYLKMVESTTGGNHLLFDTNIPLKIGATDQHSFETNMNSSHSGKLKATHGIHIGKNKLTREGVKSHLNVECNSLSVVHGDTEIIINPGKNDTESSTVIVKQRQAASDRQNTQVGRLVVVAELDKSKLAEANEMGSAEKPTLKNFTFDELIMGTNSSIEVDKNMSCGDVHANTMNANSMQLGSLEIEAANSLDFSNNALNQNSAKKVIVQPNAAVHVADPNLLCINGKCTGPMQLSMLKGISPIGQASVFDNGKGPLVLPQDKLYIHTDKINGIIPIRYRRDAFCLAQSTDSNLLTQESINLGQKDFNVASSVCSDGHYYGVHMYNKNDNYVINHVDSAMFYLQKVSDQDDSGVVLNGDTVYILWAVGISGNTNSHRLEIYRPEVFDWQSYVGRYPDLKHLSEQGLIYHWNNHGKKERRTGIPPSLLESEKVDAETGTVLVTKYLRYRNKTPELAWTVRKLDDSGSIVNDNSQLSRNGNVVFECNYGGQILRLSSNSPTPPRTFTGCSGNGKGLSTVDVPSNQAPTRTDTWNLLRDDATVGSITNGSNYNKAMVSELNPSTQRQIIKSKVDAPRAS